MFGFLFALVFGKGGGAVPAMNDALGQWSDKPALRAVAGLLVNSLGPAAGMMEEILVPDHAGDAAAAGGQKQAEAFKRCVAIEQRKAEVMCANGILPNGGDAKTVKAAQCVAMWAYGYANNKKARDGYRDKCLAEAGRAR